MALKRGQSARETLQEAVTLGQLCHPNIVRLFGITLPERPVSVLTAIYTVASVRIIVGHLLVCSLQCLVVELLDKGDLKSHLQSLRSK